MTKQLKPQTTFSHVELARLYHGNGMQVRIFNKLIPKLYNGSWSV
jgi:hypothetical protein